MDIGVVIPTHNEAETAQSLVEAVRSVVGDRLSTLVVVDGGSEDGTLDILQALSEEDERVTVVDEGAKNGIGAAYKDGFKRMDADIVVQMDADFSHLPAQLPSLVAAIEDGADVAVGSRYVAGGARNDPLHRRFFPRAGSHLYRLLLRSPVKDVTSGFKAYNTGVLEQLPYNDLPDGFHFQAASLLHLVEEGAAVVEIPIDFMPRRAGEPTYSTQDLVDNTALLARLVLDKQVFNRLPRRWEQDDSD